MNKLIQLVEKIFDHKKGRLVMGGFLGLEVCLIVFLWLNQFNSLMAMMIWLAGTYLLLEMSLRLLMKYKIILQRFSLFIDYIYKGELEEGFPTKESQVDAFYFNYHPFYHFAFKTSSELNHKKIQINSLGFRGREINPSDSNQTTVYLSGDCQMYDPYHPQEETFAQYLENKLREKQDENIVTLNAGGPHYTILHCLNRLIVDLNRIRPSRVVLTAGINDVLVFVHHKGKEISPDYTNLYKSYNEENLMAEFKNSFMTRHSTVLQLMKYRRKCAFTSFDNCIETMSPDYGTTEHIEQSRKLFTTTYYENYLRMYVSICHSFNIPLLLTTNIYNPPDMEKGPAREFAAFGLDHINEVIKKVGQEFNLPVFDYQKEFALDDTKITNKWHYTQKGNESRAKIISEFINAQPALTNK